MSGRIFNIERFATEDGPGIRTVVFLKGCGLSCKWCANPESQSFKKEIILNTNTCINCGKCADVCPNGAISFKENYGFITDKEKCTSCQKCVDACYNGSRSISGKDYTPNELLKELLKDVEYYKMSGGGITFSGGEPLLQADFINEISPLLKEQHISVLVETCGFADRKAFEKTIDNIDIIYYDIKMTDSNIHKVLTGSGNKLILENLVWLSENFKGDLSVRYPYIPQNNDKLEHIENFLEFISGINNVKEVVFLPYHRLGASKYLGLGRKYEIGDMVSLKKSDIAFLTDYSEKYNIKIKIV